MPGNHLPHQPSEALTRLARLLRILDLTRTRRAGQPLGRAELADICDCDIRTIQRDITLLQDQAGVPLEYDRKQRAYTLPTQGWVYPTVQITGDEAIALALARGMLAAPGLPCQAQIASVLAKLTAALPPSLQALSRQAAGVIQVGAATRDYSQSPLQALMEAAAARETVAIDYVSRSRRAQSTRRVDAYAVEARDGQFWELHAWCHTRGAIRTFAIDQVRDVQRTGTAFTVREEAWAAFARVRGVIGGLRGGEPVAVEVRFDPVVAPYALGRRWPEGLTIQACADGTACLSGLVAGCDGILPELLRWRRHAQVQGGPELKARMADELRAMAALYADELPKKES